ncbi:MAG: YbhN family protein [Myxococcota bacterium]
MTLLLLSVAAVAFLIALGLAWQGWLGGVLGIVALFLVVGAFVAFTLGRRRLAGTARGRVDTIAKVVFTVGGFVALLRHPIAVEDGVQPLHNALVAHLGEVELVPFLVFGALAMGIKLVGVVASAGAWYLLLRGQRIRVPFFQTVLTGFLIGRFIGTFLPSTLGLDGYTLWEAGRVTGEWHRVVTAKAVEKVAGATALFVGILVATPVLVGVFSQAFGPWGWVASVVVGGGALSVTIVGLGVLVFPGLLRAVVRLFGRVVPKVARHHVDRLTDAVVAYKGQLGLLGAAFGLKVVNHVNTAIVYWFTALAIGVTGAAFLPIVAGSLVQIVGTLVAPTIGGEGAREAIQALLLTDYYDSNPAKAVLAAALGFIAAEAATLWGGAFLWTRTPSWRPTVCEVDGVAVDRGDGQAFDVATARAQLMGATEE